jgi:3-hydroxyisobutyrate dehydrogenase-like beta-hydroxyacid dehydrogenase
MTDQVTVLGLGPMGSALARALLDAGHPTTVWNRTPAKAESLASLGASVAPTAADAIDAAPLIVACLRDTTAVRTVLEPSMDRLAGKTVVNLTSTLPRQARDDARWLARTGSRHVDGAILTPTPTIGTAHALVLYAGDEAAYRSHQPVLAALGPGRFVGTEPGAASSLDTALLDLFWSSVGGLIHALALASAEGITPRDVAALAPLMLQVLPDMAARFAERVEAGHHPGDRSTITSAAANLDHVIELAAQHGLDQGALTALRDAARQAIAAGRGDDGLSHLVEVVATPGT